MKALSRVSFLRTENSRTALCRRAGGRFRSGGYRAAETVPAVFLAFGRAGAEGSQDQHRIPHTDGSRDASMESSENASIFKTQECLWFRLKRYHCIQRLFVSVQQKSPVWGLFVRHSTAYFYFSRYLPIMQPLFGRHQRPSVKLTPAKSSAVKT